MLAQKGQIRSWVEKGLSTIEQWSSFYCKMSTCRSFITEFNGSSKMFLISAGIYLLDCFKTLNFKYQNQPQKSTCRTFDSIRWNFSDRKYDYHMAHRHRHYSSCYQWWKPAELLLLKRQSDRQTRLHSGVDAHVFQERPLRDGSQASHAPSSHPPQVAEVHVSGEVCWAGGGQDVMELMTFKTLMN